MTTAQRIQHLIEELTRNARSDEDRARVEQMRQHFTEMQEQRQREDLHVLMLLEARRYEDERLEAVLNELGS